MGEVPLDAVEVLLERAIAVLVRELSAVQQASLELQTLRWNLEVYRRDPQRKRAKAR